MPTPDEIRHLDAARRRIAIALTAATVALYFGFVFLVAFGAPLLVRPVVPGLSLGILLGAVVIVAAWALTWVYVRWANRHYDARVEALRGRR